MSNHAQAQYSFSVNGREYRGESSSPSQIAPAVGSIVPVYYDTKDASDNALEGFDVQAAGGFQAAGFFLGVAALLAAAIGLSRLWVKRRTSPR